MARWRPLMWPPVRAGVMGAEANPVGMRTRIRASGKPARSKAKPATKPTVKPTTTPAPEIARLVASSPDIDDDAEGRQRVGVQSLGRAFAILEEVARQREGIGLAELSKRVGLHNSTTFHLAKTLVSLGYIRQERDSKRYRVGRPLFALAASALDEIEMVNLATPVLEELARDTGESSHFAVRMGDAVVVRPAHCTALGKVILAALRPDQLERLLARIELKPSTERSITEVPALLREIEDVRRAGLAFDDCEFNAEVRCVAVPVRDFTGQTIGALGISGPVWRLSIQALQNRARLVEAAADRLSAEFGAREASDRSRLA